MCGICGIMGKSPENSIEAMVLAMHHRGPDDSGIFREDGFAMGMTRLAILDITPSGHQPMRNSDGSVWIIYNGETYNFKTEREVLQGKGYSFTSLSDTEVVLRMYEHYGDDFLLRMRGIFALAIFDKRRGRGRERLLLARDHLGIKPLLYARIGSNFLFASEMKAMLASGLIKRNVDPESLRLLLTYGAITQPRTAVSGVKMLLPGHRLIIEGGHERIEKYWRLDTERYKGLGELPYEELVKEVRLALEECIRLQMVSDVPVGAFLSGGIDSSLLVALMSKVSGSKISTFSVGFESEGSHIDETQDAERIAGFIGTNHTRVEVTGQRVRDEISSIVEALDQPSVDGVNSYFVSSTTSKDVTVAISGTGGDEIFAGYPWFINMDLACKQDKQHPLKSLSRELFSEVARRPLFDQLTIGRFAQRLERARNSAGFVSRYAREYQIFGVTGTARILSSDLKRFASIGRDPSHDMSLADELPTAPPIERVSALCIRGYTLNQLLRDIDAVSMAHSLEVRVPYLDPVIVDLALSLPRSAKLGELTNLSQPAFDKYSNTGSKKILFDIGREFLPEGMDNQPKRGFGMPFESWLKGPMRDILEDTTSQSAIINRGIFNQNETRSLTDRFFAGQGGWPLPWLLMITELWCRTVLDKAVTNNGKPWGMKQIV